MGSIQFSIPKEIALQLKSMFHIENFVETGTYHWDTTFWASQHFTHVYTIEASHDLWTETSNKYKHVNNIEFLYGNSRERLAELTERLQEPTLFWLDAHWSGDVTFGEGDECPLIDELKTLNNSTLEKIIMIDDARLFTLPPPSPHRFEQWPTLDEVLLALNQKESVYSVITQDCIITVPMNTRSQLASYFQKQVTTDLHKQTGLLKRVKNRIVSVLHSSG